MAEIKRKPKPQILFDENRDKFNQLVSQGKTPDLTNQNISDLDLRGFNFKNVDLSGSYLRGADLSGVDMSEACLDGVSIKKANISGAFFPYDLPAREIILSWEHGTRMRHPKKKQETKS